MPALGARIEALDGIRAIAVTAVVAYHLLPEALPGGFLGVDVFLVLSGYLITRGLTTDASTGIVGRLARFWVRRAVRLIPALAVMLVSVTAVAGLVGGGSAVRLGPQLLSALTFTGNWYQVDAGVSYFERTEPPLLQHLWSLAVEEQFYLVWPVLLIVIAVVVRRRRPAAYVAAALACTSAAAMALAFVPGEDPSRVYFGTDTHGFSMLVGAAAALVTPRTEARNGVRAVLAMGCCLLGFALLDESSTFTYRGGIALTAVAAACLVLAVTAPGRLATLLATPPLVWLGRRSYAIYLWHWPLIVLAPGIAPGMSTATRSGVVVTLTLCLAALSWRYVEHPIQRLGPLAAANGVLERLRRGGVFPTAGAVASVLAVAMAAGAISASPERTEAQDFVTAGQQAIAQQDAQGRADGSGTHRSPRGGPIGKQTTILGDSVTLASAESLLEELPGVDIRADVGEQMWDAPATVGRLRDSGDLRRNVVIALGTNGDFHSDVLDEIRATAGPGHRFVFVTTHADRDWVPSVNAKLRPLAADHRHTALADWDTAASDVTDFASDGIHPGPQGADIFADVIGAALRSLDGHASAGAQRKPGGNG